MLLKKKPHKTIIIAEIGVNHNGNFDTAKKLIKIAKEIGADYAKFQMYEPDEMIIETAKKAEYQNLSFGKSISQKDMLRKFYLSELKLIKLHKYCKKIGIKFLASVFDEISLQRYIKLKPDYIKLHHYDFSKKRNKELDLFGMGTSLSNYDNTQRNMLLVL